MIARALRALSSGSCAFTARAALFPAGLAVINKSPIFARSFSHWLAPAHQVFVSAQCINASAYQKGWRRGFASQCCGGSGGQGAKGLPAEDIARTLGQMAVPGEYPGEEVIQQLVEVAHPQIGEFRADDLSIAMLALAKMGFQPGAAFLAAAALQGEKLAHRDVLAPVDIMTLLWSFIRLQHPLGEQFLTSFGKVAQSKIEQYEPETLATTLWCFATLKHSPGQPLLDAFVNRAISRAEDFDQRQMATTLWSVVVLGYSPAPELLHRVEKYALQLLPSFRAEHLSGLLWAFGELSHRPEPDALQKFEEEVVWRVEAQEMLQPQAANVVGALVKMGHVPEKLLMAVRRKMPQEQQDESRVGTFAKELRRLAGAPASRRLRPNSPELLELVEQVPTMLPGCTGQELATIMISLATLEVTVDEGTMLQFESAAEAGLPTFAPQSISTVLLGFATFQHTPGEIPMKKFCDRIEESIAFFETEDLVATVWAFWRLRHNPGSDVLHALESQVEVKLESFDERDAYATLEAFYELGHALNPVLLGKMKALTGET